MRARGSIALRLALWLSIGMALFWIGAATISGLVMRHELANAYDESLRQSAFRLLPLARREIGPEDDHDDDPVPGISRRGRDEEHGAPAFAPTDEESFTYIVYDPTGTIRVRAEDAPATLPAVPDRDGFTQLDGHRGFVASDRRSGLSILVLETTSAREDALRDAVAGLFLPLAALIPLVAVGIWYAVRIALRPVRRLSAAIATRSGSNLAPLDDASQPAELVPIARETAALLERLRAALEAERAFAASSAHELRTPIAGALAQAQRLAAELGDHPSAARLEDVQRALRGLSDLAEKLLQLSRLEAGFARSDDAVDLRPVLELVIGDFNARQAGASPQVRLTVEPDTQLSQPINLDAFAIALRNLVQNAIIHGTSGGTVEVIAGPGPLVRVRSRGPVVPPDVLSRLRQRFARGATRASGTGLGLAVVDAIMAQVGGVLVLQSPAPGWEDGFEARLEFPGRASGVRQKRRPAPLRRSGRRPAPAR